MVARLTTLATGLRNNPTAHLAALVLFGAAAFLPELGQEVDLANREARHAEIAREMVATGQYLVPHVCGELYPDKAPLFNWTAALLFRLAGRADYFLARLPSALSAIAVLVAVYILGRRWFSVEAALVAAAVWATTPLVGLWARQCRSDMLLTCLLAYATLLADSAAVADAAWQRWAAWLGASALAALATLAKGPHAVLFFAIAAMALWRAPPALGSPWRLVLAALGLIAAVVGAWAIGAEASYPGYLKALTSHQFGVGLRQHPMPVYYYLLQLPLHTLPWSLFVAGAVIWAVRQRRRRGYTPALTPALVFCAMLILHSLVKNKRVHYMLPAIPMWALWLGALLAESSRPLAHDGREAARAPGWSWLWPAVLALGLALAGALAGPFAWAGHARGGIAVVVVLCVALAGLAAWGLVAAWRKRGGQVVCALCAACALVGAAWFPLWVRYVASPTKEVRAAWEVMASIPPGALVAAYKSESEHLLFKLGPRVLLVASEDAARAFLAPPGPRCLITSAGKSEEVRRLTARRMRELLRWDTERDKGVLLLADD